MELGCGSAQGVIYGTTRRNQDVEIEDDDELMETPDFPDLRRTARTRGGYNWVYMPGHPQATQEGFVLWARVVLEDRLGRYLDKNESPVWLDGDTLNDDPANIALARKHA
jgi:hypothetical protein